MATPKEVFESPVYRELTQEPQEIPWAWFKDVYEALGDVLQMLDKQQSEIEKELARAKAEVLCASPPVSVKVNAPLALLQTDLEARVATLEWVLVNTKPSVRKKMGQVDNTNFVSGGRNPNHEKTCGSPPCKYLETDGCGGWCQHSTNRVLPTAGWPNGFAPSVSSTGGCDLHEPI